MGALAAIRNLILDPLSHVIAPESVWHRIAETWMGDVMDMTNPEKPVVKGSATIVEGAKEALACADGCCKVQRLSAALKGYNLASAFGPYFADLDGRRVKQCWSNASCGAQLYRYVDLGCGKGDKTVQIKRQLDLDESQVIGYEVFNTSYSTVTHAHLANITFRKFDGRTLTDEVDQSVSLVTCIMSLHHAALPEKLVREVRRIMIPGGIVVIKEHDCPDGQGYTQWWSSYFDLYHRTFAAIVVPDKPFELLAQYRSRSQWRQLFESAGFQLAYSIEEYEDVNMRSYYDAFVRQ